MTALPVSVPAAIGVGFDTSRYGHHVTFLREDLQPACSAFEFPETRAGYEQVLRQLQSLHERWPNAHFHIRLDAAGQYATNLEVFLRGLPLAKTLTVGEPARNQHYRQALFPKRKADPIESLCAARFALVEKPAATADVPAAHYQLREIVQRLEAQTRQATRLTNQLHNLLARVFPELALEASDLKASWVLRLLAKYPTPALVARARPATLAAIPYLAEDKAALIQARAAQSVASLTGDTAATLVRQLVEQLQRSLAEEAQLKKLMIDVYRQLPEPNHLNSIPGIGDATAAVLTAKIVTITRFATPSQLVSYFGVFPQEDSSGIGRDGLAKPGRRTAMSRKGNDLVRKYLWNAAKSAILHNPAVRALYRRLRARGTRGDVALGQCMGKLLRLGFAVWATGGPFNPDHYPWESAAQSKASEPADVRASDASVAQDSNNEKTAGHNQSSCSESSVVTAVTSTITAAPTPNQGNPPPVLATPAPARAGRIDFAALRGQVRMEQVLAHLGCLTQLKGSGQQRRGPCPLHARNEPGNRSFSVHLGKNAFQCFHASCAAHGNALDLWAAAHRLPLYEAALHLANTFNFNLASPNREEEPVREPVPSTHGKTKRS
jgi:transposase